MKLCFQVDSRTVHACDSITKMGASILLIRIEPIPAWQNRFELFVLKARDRSGEQLLHGKGARSLFR